MQRRKPKPQTYRKSNVYNSFFYILRVTTIRASNHKRSLTNFRALKATQKTPQTVTLKTRDTLSFEFAASKKTFNISYLSLHLKILCICDVQTNKRKKKHVKRFWHAKISRLSKETLSGSFSDHATIPLLRRTVH